VCLVLHLSEFHLTNRRPFDACFKEFSLDFDIEEVFF